MDITHRRIVAFGLAGVLVVLAGVAGAFAPRPVVGVLPTTLLLVAAIGAAAYGAASLAVEHVLDGRALRAAAPRAREGHDVRPVAVKQAVQGGVGTARELAEVLGVYEHVAHRMLASLAAEGVLVEASGRYQFAPQRHRATAAARAPHWIDPDV